VRAAAALEPALLPGTVRHRRRGGEVRHGFSQKVLFAWVDPDAVPHWLARRGPVWFDPADHIGDGDVAGAARGAIAAAGASSPLGPVRTLTQLRSAGWLFNPITVHAVWDDAEPSSAQPDHLVVAVTNTPWHERHVYVLSTPPSLDLATTGIVFDKELHVSPFLGMDLRHRVRLDLASTDIRLDVDDLDPATGDVVFEASLQGSRQPLEQRAARRAVVQGRLPTHRTSLGIHRQAFSLWRKGARFHRHPERVR
jgi:uncharacterized protein